MGRQGISVQGVLGSILGGTYHPFLGISFKWNRLVRQGSEKVRVHISFCISSIHGSYGARFMK